MLVTLQLCERLLILRLSISSIAPFYPTKPIMLTNSPKVHFCDCGRLKKVILPPTISVIGALAFHKCYSLRSIHLPIGLTRIEASAFYNCLSLNYILFPEQLSYIGHWAFAGCVGLRTIILKSAKLVELEKNSHIFFEVNKQECSVWVSKKMVDEYMEAYQWRSFENFNRRCSTKAHKSTIFNHFLQLSLVFRKLVAGVVLN